MVQFLFTNILESTQYIDINLPIQNICEKQELQSIVIRVVHCFGIVMSSLYKDINFYDSILAITGQTSAQNKTNLVVYH